MHFGHVRPMFMSSSPHIWHVLLHFGPDGPSSCLLGPNGPSSYYLDPDDLICIILAMIAYAYSCHHVPLILLDPATSSSWFSNFKPCKLLVSWCHLYGLWKGIWYGFISRKGRPKMGLSWACHMTCIWRSDKGTKAMHRLSCSHRWWTKGGLICIGYSHQ